LPLWGVWQPVIFAAFREVDSTKFSIKQLSLLMQDDAKGMKRNLFYKRCGCCGDATAGKNGSIANEKRMGERVVTVFYLLWVQLIRD